MKKLSVLVLSLALATTAGIAQAADAAKGKAKAATCAGCHGAKGVSNSPLWPNLAGQKEAYILKQLKDFKSGARKNDGGQMKPMVAPLSEDDMKNLAAYFSGLK